MWKWVFSIPTIHKILSRMKTHSSCIPPQTRIQPTPIHTGAPTPADTHPHGSHSTASGQLFKSILSHTLLLSTGFLEELPAVQIFPSPFSNLMSLTGPSKGPDRSRYISLAKYLWLEFLTFFIAYHVNTAVVQLFSLG